MLLRSKPLARTIALLGACLIAAGTLAACGKHEAEQKMTFNMGDGQLTTDAKGSSVYKGDDGSTASVDGAGPVALPPGLDVYPGATVSTHMVMDVSPTMKSYVVAASTPASINQVLDHYRGLAKAGGFTVDTDKMDSDSSSIVATKGGAGFSVLVKPNVPNTDFQLSAHAPTK